MNLENQKNVNTNNDPLYFDTKMITSLNYCCPIEYVLTASSLF